MRFWRVLPFLACLCLSAIPAKASDRLPVVGPTDFHFILEEPAVFKARAWAIEYGIDSMLWLYDAAGEVIAANDDFYGLDSWLEVPIEPGVYRLRAGVCCGNPEAWYGQSYEVELNTVPQEPTTTTTSTTTTSTTTTSTTTTTVPETTTTVEETTTTEATTTTTEATTTTTTTEPTPPIVIPPPPETTWPSTTLPSTTTTVEQPTSTELVATVPTEPEQDSTTAPATTSVATTEPAVVPSVSETVPIAAPSTEPVATEPPLAPVEPVQPLESALPPAPPADATEDVKRAFEEEVNVFAGGYDDYVPAGSTVTVAQRRTIVAATVVFSSAIPMGSSRRQR